MDPELQAIGQTLRGLLTAAWLLPLAGFAVEIYALKWASRLSKAAAYLAVACIVGSFALSVAALVTFHSFDWSKAHPEHHASAEGGVGAGGAQPSTPLETKLRQAAGDEGEVAHPHNRAAGAIVKEPAHPVPHAEADAHPPAGDAHAAGADHGHDAHAEHHVPKSPAFTGVQYTLARFGGLVINIDYYIDSLTVLMFAMVTLIASCIHVFAIGYMSEELTEAYEDHQVHVGHGHFVRPGRFYRFFAFLSLFSFSMLGLVLAGSAFLVFVFWELVGVCSYFLIGFYVERKSASTAANKAFIMNRVGDFGFIIGLMILVTHFGTTQFSTYNVGKASDRPGLFEMARGADGELQVASQNGSNVVVLTDAHDHPLTDAAGNTKTVPYLLLVTAGLGVFAGCIGKSAQFPLQTWLPDAMEGPTPVSALVHSATMVAAGVYLAGRFFPMFTPEVLLAIAYIGCITLFLAATIAVVATDIKRVLAYSTISQLGYMMLAIGLGGWAAGLFHLITHAFFKSLMFLCSGSVIYGCHHEQEMPKMGGLWRKMPITAFTMLVGVIAICGLAIPGVIAFSGYHSKDAIIATAMTYAQINSLHALLFIVPLAGAGITAFYMFRLWFYTFVGEPRDKHVYDHAHESPWVMTAPLILLSVFAAFCAVGGESGPLFREILASEPTGLADGVPATAVSHIALPSHAQVHANHATAGGFALLVAVVGTVVAYFFYGAGKYKLNPGEVQARFSGLHAFLVEKWQFDTLYDAMFVRPVHVVASWATAIDKYVFDGFLHTCARGAVQISYWDRLFDETIVDGLVNWFGNTTYNTGFTFRRLQTGRLRQYVMFIVVGVIIIGGFGLFWLLRLQGA